MPGRFQALGWEKIILSGSSPVLHGQDCRAAEWQETNRTRMQSHERAKGSRARTHFYPLMPQPKLPNPMKHRITVPQQTPQKQ
jgi:hypothetical protein